MQPDDKGGQEPRLDHIHSDARGDIYRLLVPPDLEVMLFRCKAGQLRGGHSHTVPEVVSVLAGAMNYHRIIGGQYNIERTAPGDCRVNLPGQPHMGEFLEDSWVIEWKFGPNAGIGKWETVDYPPLRERVLAYLRLEAEKAP